MKNFGLFIVIVGVLLSCSSEKQEGESQFYAKDKTDTDTSNAYLVKLEEQLEADPENIKLWIEKGLFCKEKMDFSCALDAGAKAFLLDSTNLEARSLYAWTLINKPEPPLGDIERAKRHYKYILSVKKNDPDLMVELANTYSLTGDFETSFKYINDALRINDKHRDAYVLKGSNYRVVGNFELALSSYQTAVQIDPDFYMGHLQIAYLLTENENHKLALEYYNNAAQIDDNALEALYGIAKSHQDLGQYEEAQIFYREILNINPDFYFSYFNQGYIKQYHQNQIDSAIYYYNLTLEIEPESVLTLHHLGEAYYEQDRISDAARAFAKVLTLNPDYKPTLKAKEKLKQ